MSQTRHPVARTLLDWLLYGTAYYLLAELGLNWATTLGVGSTVWPASGLGLAAVLLGGFRVAPAIFAATLLAIADTPFPWLAKALVSASNVAQLGIALYYLRTSGAALDFRKSRDVIRLLVAALLASVGGALVGATSVQLPLGWSWPQWANTAWNWCVGDTLGVLLVTPLILAWRRWPPWSEWWPPRWGFLACLAAMTVSAWLVFGRPHAHPLAFIVFPLLLWVARHFSTRGLTLTLALVAVLAIWGVTYSSGPATAASSNTARILFLQLFLGVMSGSMLLFSAAVAERTEAIRLLERSRDELERRVEERTAELRRAHHGLEQRVEERTAELTAANASLTEESRRRKQAEQERRRLEERMQQEQKLESLGVLAGGIAHDFNNLLTSILGYMDLTLMDLPPRSPAAAHVEEAISGTRRAAELTTQLLAYSGKGRFVVEPLDLSALVEDMTRLLQISISKKNLLKLELTPGLPAVEADAVQVRQLIMNLIINASESLSHRGGVITVATGVRPCDRAYLSGTTLGDRLPEGEYAFLEVSDDGCGMSDATRAKIFDPFFTTKSTGRGLGLSAALGIVRGHRGALECASEEGRGTTFRVLFPVTGQRAAAAVESGVGAAPWQGSGKVLVVDDEEALRALAGAMLSRLGFTVLTAADGREALEIFRAEADEIRLVLLDMTMPHLDGAETFREMRRLRADVKAILQSGYDEQTSVSQFAGKGLAGFIQKPYRFRDLVAIVRRTLESQGPAGQAGER